MGKLEAVWIDRMPIGYAKMRIESNDKDEKQFRFSQVNESFELIVGMDRVVIEGKTFQEIVLESLEVDCKLKEFCESICKEEKAGTFEKEVSCNGRNFKVSANYREQS